MPIRFFVYTLLPLLAVLSGHLSAQTRISGVVNSYAAVRALNLDCRQTVGLDRSLQGVVPGSRIIIVQMKGASVDSLTGEMTSLGRTGTFEYAEIAQVLPNMLVLSAPLRKQYDVSAFVQVVTVARYDSAIVVQQVQPLPWDGAVGGVVVLDVAGRLSLQANINATGMGFRGGRASVVRSVICNDMRLFSEYALGGGGEKGEGWSTALSPGTASRAPWCGGGGGGGDHNGGGGGGGGAGVGGQGGYQWEGCGPTRAAHGLGGSPALDPPNSIALVVGGGGGGGHQNDRGGAAGAPGGGVVIVRAGILQSQGSQITAAGRHGIEAVLDGGGGGGGGGTVVLEASTILGAPTLDVSGGNGSSIRSGPDLHGTGGGGGGGRIIYANRRAPVGVSNLLNGGRRGVNAGHRAAINAHGAEDGAAGSLVLLADIPLHPQMADPLLADMPRDTTVCHGTPVAVPLSMRGGYPPYRWSVTSASGALIAANSQPGPVIATQDSVLLLTVTDSVGCTVTDTMRIVVEDRAWLAVESAVVGPLVCEMLVDTAIIIRNPSNDTIFVYSIDVTAAGVQLDVPALPLRIPPGSSMRLPARIVPQASGTFTASIRIRSNACTPDIVASLTYLVERPEWSAPTLLAIQPHIPCNSPPNEGVIDIASRSTGAAAVRVDTAFTDAPFTIERLGPTRFRVRWTPSKEGIEAGVVTLVLLPCGDTLRVPVTAESTTPQLVISGGGALDVLTETVDVEVVNVGSGSADITSAVVTDAGYTLLVVGATLPKVLAPGEKLVLRVGLASGAAPQRTRVEVRSATPCDTTLDVGIRRERGVRARIATESFITAPGSIIVIPITIENVASNVYPLLQQWQARVRVNRNALQLVVDGIRPTTVTFTVEHEQDTTTIALSDVWVTDGRVAELSMRTLFERSARSAVEFDQTIPLWVNLEADVVQQTEYVDGEVDLTGSICTRPARVVSFGRLQGTVEMYDVLGRRKRVLNIDVSTDDELWQFVDASGEDNLSILVLRNSQGLVLWRGLR